MLISFIIPHYNLQREYLQRCVASIVAQGIDVEDYEILIVDDGSDAPPEWVVGPFAPANVRLIKSSNGGPGAARNRGIDEAQGEYIQFVDADDSLVPDSFVRLARLLKSEKPDILQHGYRICHTEEQMLQPAKAPEKRRIYASGAEYVSQNNLSGSPCVYIFKRAVVTAHNMHFAEGVLHEDEDFNIKIYHYCKSLVVSNTTAYNYYQRGDSITTSSNALHEEKRINDLFSMLKRVVDFRLATEKECTTTQRAALDRKLAMLTVDTLLNIFYNGKSAAETENICRGKLHTLGLYPLPAKNYSLKYRLFAALANNSQGLRLLRAILPSQKPQKR